MKVSVSPITTPTVRSFPKLMQSTNGNGIVVLKENDRSGVVMAAGRSTWSVGQHYSSWNLDFADFVGAVILEND